MALKKVLIVCEIFPPDFGPRMGYLCKYLNSLGWEAVIVTEHTNEIFYPYLAENQTVKYINFYPEKNKFLRKIKWLFVLIADYFFNYKDFVLSKVALKEAEEHSFSLVLASSHLTFPLKAAYTVSKKLKLPLIVDLRDIVEQHPNWEFIDHNISSIPFIKNAIASTYAKKLVSTRNKVLKKADFVTTISEWHKQKLTKFNKNTRLIYNGFDSELFYPQKNITSQFKIVYTGRISSLTLRNPELLFQAVNNLAQRNEIEKDKFRIQFYMDEKSKSIVQKEAEKYQVADFIDYFPIVPGDEIPIILNHASLLLLLTNKFDGGSKGIMTTKFFEYLAVEKPILCVTSDEGDLEQAVKDAHAGLAARTVEETVDFLRKHYQTWKIEGCTSIEINKDDTQKYDRQYQAKQFVELFEFVSK